MATFKNSPRIVTVGGKRMMEVFTHQPLTFDHFDTHCQIQSNGRVKLTRPVPDSEEYDEIEIPASLIFKLVGLLKDTRSVEFVEVDENHSDKKASIKQSE
jgi:hypothetical protein